MTAAARALAVVPEPAAEAPPSRFHVDALIEGGDIVSHSVQVELSPVEWRMLVGDIAARVLTLRSHGRPVIAKMLAAGVRPGGLVQQNALDDLVHMLAGPTHRGSGHSLPPVWELTPEDALAMGCGLLDAADDPVFCACGKAVPRPSQLTKTCDECVDRLGGDR